MVEGSVASVDMEIGVALPTMACVYTRRTTVTWSQGIDAGPFSSV